MRLINFLAGGIGAASLAALFFRDIPQLVNVTLARLLQFLHPREQQEWSYTIKAVIRGNTYCKNALEALKREDLTAAFDFADKASRIKVELGACTNVVLTPAPFAIVVASCMRCGFLGIA